MKNKIIKTLAVIFAIITVLPMFACGKKAGKQAGTKAFKPETGKVQIFQLAPENSSLMMSYVIKTPNNKIVVIDGGIDGTGLEADPYLPSAIRAVLGLKQNDYFEVEAWFLSHAHKDHYNELAKMLSSYVKGYSNYKINNFYFDFPEFGTEWKSRSGDNDHDLVKLKVLRSGINNYFIQQGQHIPDEIKDKRFRYWYDRVNGAVINEDSVKEGLSIDIDGVGFDILQTWNKTDSIVNSTSIVIRMVYGEHSVLFLGDSATDSASRLLRSYGADALKSEYVQLGHHGQAGPDQRFYDSIDTKNSIRLWPTPNWVWEVLDHATLHTDTTRSWMGLPKDFKEFVKTDRDYIAGKYENYPKDPTKVDSWTDEVLRSQLVAVW